VVERKKSHGEVIADDLAFPGARQAGQRSGLPISGNAHRHTFRTIAVDCEISEMLIHFLCDARSTGLGRRLQLTLGRCLICPAGPRGN
jgi:hypothetical protein